MKGRRVLLGALLALGMGAITFGPLPAAEADFAADCSAPTRTLSGGGSTPITLAAGETLLLTSGAFSGGINAFPSGSRLCVSGSAALSPAYLNDAQGQLVVGPGGTSSFSSVTLSTGFAMTNEGTVTFGNLNVNGAATIENLTGATMTFTNQFSPSAGGLVNDGTLVLQQGLNLNTGAALNNRQDMHVTGQVNLNGPFVNTGFAQVAGGLTVNGSGSLDNRCALTTTQNLANNGPSSNAGIVDVGGTFSNNGSWTQSQTGATLSGALGNDGTVSGFGRFQVDGNSSTQNTFAGASASDPIVVHDLTPPTPPQIFDTQAGTVVNVVASTVRAEPPSTYPAPGCTDAPRPSADLVVEKSAPATVQVGDQVTFTITVRNLGTDPATNVIVTDSLPTGLTAVSASAGGVVSAGAVAWDVGTLPANGTQALTVQGTAAAVGTLVNSVAGSSETPDPDPTNNDGTSDAANTTTEVLSAPPPPNLPPLATNETFTGVTGRAIFGRLEASDPEVDQELAFAALVRPTHGRLALLTTGAFGYLPEPDFAGHDTFDFEVCDNGDPVLCDTATVNLEVFPVAEDDNARTFQGRAVQIPVGANDSLGAVIGAIASGPADGTAAVSGPGVVEYVPDPAFLGVDTFTYTWCSTDAPALCDTATVRVVVIPLNNRPVVQPTIVRTVTDIAATGSVAGGDPNGDQVTFRRGVPSRSGRATVQPDGSFVYVPRPGFSGVDSFSVIGCDNGVPRLCSTATVRVLVFPVAVDDRTRTTQGRPVTFAVLDNDRGAGNETPRVVVSPTFGEARVDGKGVAYTPDPAFSGTDELTYRICAPGTEPLCDRAVLTITVSPTPPGPPDPSPTPGPGTSPDSVGGGLAETGGPAVLLVVLGLALTVSGGALLSPWPRRRQR